MSLSLVIPTYTISDDLEEMAITAALSYRPQVDELIISEDGGRYSEELRSIADVYIYNKKNEGFTVNVNRGWKMATSRYTAIVNSDTSLITGELKDLCIPGIVTSPSCHNQSAPYLWGAFFVVPKEVKEQRGMLLEDMKMYSSDSEYDVRVRDIFKKVETVEVYHAISQTVKASKIDETGLQTRDRNIYAQLKKQGVAK